MTLSTEMELRAAVALARAAIRAMREPTEEMVAAYMSALEHRADPKKEPWHKVKMMKRWKAMIDAASPPEEA